MISLSTPFSFDTASTTIKISLFIVRTPLTARFSRSWLQFRGQARPVYVVDRQPDRAAVQLERDVARSPRFQPDRESLAPVHGLHHLQPHTLAGEALEVLPRAQYPIETRRGHLEGVAARDGVGRVERFAHRATHLLAVVE